MTMHALGLDDALGGDLRRLAGQGPVTVLPCVDSYLSYRRLVDAAPPGVTIADLGSDLDRAADGLAGFIHNIDDWFQLEPDTDDDWRVTDLAERSPYVSSLLLNLARRTVCAGTAEPGRYVVVNEDAGLARLLAGRGRPTSSVLRFVRARLGGTLRTLARRKALARLRRNRPVEWDELSQCSHLIVTWAAPGTFADPELPPQGSHLAALPDILEAAGARIGYVVLPTFWLADFSDTAAKALANRRPVLFVEDCITPSDIAAAGFRRFGFRHRVAASAKHDGVDLAPVLRHEAGRAEATWRQPQAALFRTVGRELARHGAAPAAVVHPYENQPWENGLHQGLRRHLPGACVVGVQHTPVGDRYGSLWPSRHAVEAGAGPDRYLVTGPAYREKLIQAGIAAIRPTVSGALRYDGIPEVTTADPTDDAYVLCCLTIEADESLELAMKVAAAAAGLPEIPFRINFHPYMAPETQKQIRDTVGGGKAPANLAFSPDGARTLLPGARVVVYTGSAVAFDAAIAGLPTIFVGRDAAVDQDKLPAGVSVSCRTVDDLIDALTAGAVGNRAERRQTVAGILAPIDREAIFEAVPGLPGGHKRDIADAIHETT